jgi:hypothetical protein
MDKRDNGASARQGDEDAAWDQTIDDGQDTEHEDAEEVLSQELASFAFLREEGDREVRLHFRDVPANEVARAFRRAGALFISMTGERARAMQPPPVSLPDDAGGLADEEMPPLSRRRRRGRAGPGAQSDPSRPPGELTMRYFFATETLVYTVVITTSTGMMQSIVSIYPSAELSERELETRLVASFR